MLPTLRLQVADLQASFDTGDGLPITAGLDAGHAAGEGAEALGADFASLLQTPQPPVTLLPGGAPLPVTGNALPASEAPDSVPLSTLASDSRAAGVTSREGALPLLVEARALRPVAERLARAPEGVNALAEGELATTKQSPATALPVVAVSGTSQRGESRHPFANSLIAEPERLLEQLQPVPRRSDPVLVTPHGVASPEQPALRVPRSAQDEARLPLPVANAAEQITRSDNGLSLGADSLKSSGATTPSGQVLPAPVTAAAPASAHPVAPPPAATVQAITAVPTFELAISEPLNGTAWRDTFSQTVVNLAGQRTPTAEIRITPAELGPIRVSIAMEDGATNVSFAAQHALTRDAIESALPRLRDMLQENGLTLGNASVFDQRERHDGRNAGEGMLGRIALADEMPEDGPDPHKRLLTAVVPQGSIDTFA